MSTSPAGPSGDSGYIRGGGGIDIDTSRAVRFLVASCMVVLVGLVVALTISTVYHNDRQAKLQRKGVPVQVTVSGCVGVSSGIGQAIVSYTCRGSYSLDGRTYTEVIGGSSALHHAGDKLDGVALRDDPGSLSTTSAVADKKTSYLTPIVLGLAAVGLALGLVFWPRRSRDIPSPPEAST